MTEKKRRAPSFDTMIKFFLKQYNFATKQDIHRLVQKVENLERLISSGASSSTRTRSQGKTLKHKSASDLVIDVISDIGSGANFADIQSKTQYEDKKLRNIIYRLTKQGKIRRKKRGLYLPA